MFVQPASKAHVTQRITVPPEYKVEKNCQAGSQPDTLHWVTADKGSLHIMHLIFAQIFYLNWSIQFATTTETGTKRRCRPSGEDRSLFFPGKCWQNSCYIGNTKRTFSSRGATQRCTHTHTQIKPCMLNTDMTCGKIQQSLHSISLAYLWSAFDIPSSTTSFGPETTWSNVNYKRHQKASNPIHLQQVITAQCLMVFSELNYSKSTQESSQSNRS